MQEKLIKDYLYLIVFNEESIVSVIKIIFYNYKYYFGH
jgi:hypothetical protein